MSDAKAMLLLWVNTLFKGWGKVLYRHINSHIKSNLNHTDAHINLGLHSAGFWSWITRGWPLKHEPPGHLISELLGGVKQIKTLTVSDGLFLRKTQLSCALTFKDLSVRGKFISFQIF